MAFRLHAIAAILGCLLACQWSRIPAVTLLLSILPLGLLTLRLRMWGSLPAVMLVAMIWTLLRAGLLLEPGLPVQLEGRTLSVEGQISSIAEVVGENGLRFEFTPQRLLHDSAHELPQRLRLNWFRDAPQLGVGQHWRLQIRLKRPVGFFNRGGFDYEFWLFRQGLRATGYVVASADNRQIEAASGYPVERTRAFLQGRIQAHLDGHPLQGLIEALSIGQRQNISAEQWQDLRATGTAHLVAISGLHIGLAGLIGYLLGACVGMLCGSWLSNHLPAPKLGIVTALLVALGYAALAGFALPTQRALVMLTCVSVVHWCGWRIAAIDLLLMAALLILLLDPLSVLTAGFWLSFGAVVLILYALSGRTATTHRWLDFARVSLVTGVGLLPLLALYFGQHPLWSPLVNLLAVPWASFICVPLVLLAVSCELLLPQLAATFWQWLATGMDHLWLWIEWCAQLPAGQLTLTRPGPLTLLCTVMAVLLLLSPAALRWRWLGVLWLLPLLLPATDRPRSGSFELSLLDVGQGLSAVIRTRRHTLVFDTGARFSADFDIGSAVLVPWLQARGDSVIDRLVVSHADNDHRGGVASVLEQMAVRDMISGEAGALAGARSCYRGQQWQWDGVQFEVLWPKYGHQLEGNNASCVVKVSAGDRAVLLPGDIEWQSELDLVRISGDDLQADILLAAHHGSESSSTPAFIDSVAPATVLIAAGYRNRYGFPGSALVERFQQRGVTGYNSFACGELRFLVTPQGIIQHAPMRSREGRFWHTVTGDCKW